MGSREGGAVVADLELLVRCEEVVGGYYGACADVWPADRGFWLGLSDEEATHAVRLELLAERILAGSGPVGVAPLFPRAALETFVELVAEQRVRVLDGDVSRRVALALSKHVERTLIDIQALRAIAVSLPDWQGCLNEIAAEERGHELRVVERFAREAAALAA